MIEFEFDSKPFDSYLKILDQRGIDYSLRFAMNRAIIKSRAIANKRMKEKRGIDKTTSPSIDEYLETEKVRMRDIRNLKSVRLRALSKGKTGLIHHILGKHSPQNIGGVAMRLRRRLYAKLARTGEHPKSFIARPRWKRGSPDERGMPQVFTRANFKGRNRLIRQTLADAHQLTTRDDIQKEMEREAMKTVKDSFYMMIERRLNELNREPLTLGEQRVLGK